MTVRVVTDSSAVVPRDWALDAGVRVVPLQLGWPDGTSSPADIPYKEYARLSEQHGTWPRTAAPSPGTYQSLCEALLTQATSIVVICPPAELSATYSNALLAARAVGDERVRVIDARTAAAGQGIVAVQAARASRDNASLDQVVDRALDVAAHVEIWATLQTLDQLRRSGRVPAIAAAGAGSLGLQPIVHYSKGSPRVVGVTRSAARAAGRVARAWERSVVADANLDLVVLHCQRGNDAHQILDRVMATAPHADARVVEVSAGLAAHTGPGLLGIAWLWGTHR